MYSQPVESLYNTNKIRHPFCESIYSVGRLVYTHWYLIDDTLKEYYLNKHTNLRHLQHE